MVEKAPKKGGERERERERERGGKRYEGTRTRIIFRH